MENKNFERQISDEVKSIRKTVGDHDFPQLFEEKDFSEGGETEYESEKAEKLSDNLRRTLLARTSEIIGKIDAYLLEKGEISGKLLKYRDELLRTQGELEIGQQSEEVPMESLEESSKIIRKFADNLSKFRDVGPAYVEVNDVFSDYDENYFILKAFPTGYEGDAYVNLKCSVEKIGGQTLVVARRGYVGGDTLVILSLNPEDAIKQINKLYQKKYGRE